LASAGAQAELCGEIDIDLLGPFVLRVDGEAIEVSAPKERGVLSLLGMRCGLVVGIDEMVAALWGDNPPRSARAAIQTYVSALRRRLPAGSIATEGEGYRLGISQDRVDSLRFVALVKQAKGIGSDDPRRSAELLSQAIGMWRGAALADLGAHQVGQREAAHLGEMLLTAEEDRFDARLACGDHQDLIAELMTAVDLEPYRERRWAQMMLALYRSGRQSQALGAYQRLRTRLSEDLGVEPSEPLRQLELAVLQQSADLDWVAPSDPPAPDPQLPALPSRLALLDTADRAHASNGRRALRGVPDDEFGIEPPAELPSLEEAMILTKPGMNWRPTSLDGQGRADQVTTSITSSIPPNVPGQSVGPPLRRTRMVGRLRDLERLTIEVTRRRLINLIGPGGVGKSRMALEAAWVASREFGEGSRWIELGSLTSRDEVTGGIATALDLPPPEDGPLDDAIGRWLERRHLLLVLDNCEHLLDAVAGLVERIASTCANVTVLATSREPLDIAGEVVWPIQPLNAAEALELFEERAFEADASLKLSETDRGAVRRICEQVDNLPLAIEIAAARVRTMTLTDIQEQLPGALPTLTVRTAPERHRDLHSNLDWSLRLLTEEDRLLFAQLSAFPAGYNMNAVEAICTAPASDRNDLSDRLSDLVDKSLLIADRHGLHTRYRLLAAVRHLGRDELGSATVSQLQDRHRQHYSRIAADISHAMRGTGPNDGALQLELEWDNFRAAFGWAFDARNLPQIQSLLASTGIWAVRALKSEHGDWTRRALSLATELGQPDPDILGLAAEWASWAGDHAGALSLATETVGLALEGPVRATAWVRIAFSNVRLGQRGEVEAALIQAELSLERCGDPYTFVVGHAVLHPIIAVGYPERATQHGLMVRKAAAELDNPMGNAMVARMTVSELSHSGDSVAALAAIRPALDAAQLAGAKGLQMNVEAMALALLTFNEQFSSTGFIEILSQLKGSAYGETIWSVLEILAVTWARQGSLDNAAVILGHLDACNQRYPHPELARFRSQYLDPVGALSEYQMNRTRGAQMSREELLDFSLECLDPAV